MCCCGWQEDPELFRMARVGLGALGVVTDLTLQCVPAHRLVEQTYVTTSQVSTVGSHCSVDEGICWQAGLLQRRTKLTGPQWRHACAGTDVCCTPPEPVTAAACLLHGRIMIAWEQARLCVISFREHGALCGTSHGTHDTRQVSSAPVA